MWRSTPVLLTSLLFVCGCGANQEPKVLIAKTKAIECWPRMKLEVDPEAPTIRWSRWFSQARVRLLVRSSANQPMQLGIAVADRQTVFFIDNLPKTKAGEEFVVEVWDDQSSTVEEQEAMAKAIAAGLRLVVRTLGDKMYAVPETLIQAQEFDVTSQAIASWNASNWKFLGKANAVVGNNGLPDLRHANAISIMSASDPRQKIGNLILHADAEK